MQKPSFLFFLLTIPFLGFGQERFTPPHYTSTLIQNNLIIDGDHDEIWNLSPWSSNWRDIISGEEGLYRTRFKSAWNKDFLYFFIELIDPNISASIDTNHAPLFKYDHTLELFLDPNNDQQNYYELQINAMESRWELTLNKPYSQGGVSTSPNEISGLAYNVKNIGTLNNSVDIDQMWTVEIALPWDELKMLDVNDIPPSQPMRINLSRVYQDDDDVNTPGQYWLWAPIGEFNIHIPDRWGWLHFD